MHRSLAITAELRLNRGHTERASDADSERTMERTCDVRRHRSSRWCLAGRLGHARLSCLSTYESRVAPKITSRFLRNSGLANRVNGNTRWVVAGPVSWSCADSWQGTGWHGGSEGPGVVARMPENTEY